jgi:hypothetical protein
MGSLLINEMNSHIDVPLSDMVILVMMCNVDPLRSHSTQRHVMMPPTTALTVSGCGCATTWQ